MTNPNPDPTFQKASRPDPFFKRLTQEQAFELGLQLESTELLPLQQSTQADLILSVPPGVTTEGTIFEFFRATNIVEFKSQNDPLDLRKYVLNELRTSLVFLQRKHTSYSQLLNVIISAREPESFLELAALRGCPLEKVEGQPWLRRGTIGFQDVAIVVLRDLPLESRFYPWLLFAPTDSRKWQAFIQRLLDEKNFEMLGLARRLKPVEVNMLTQEKVDRIIAEAMAELPPEEVAAMEREEAESEASLAQTLQAVPPRIRLKGLSPEARLEGLSPETRLEGLSPEQILTGLSEEQRQAFLKMLGQSDPQAATPPPSPSASNGNESKEG